MNKKKDRQKIKRVMYFDPGQFEKLQILSEETHVPMAYYMREALRLFLATKEKPKARGT